MIKHRFLIPSHWSTFSNWILCSCFYTLNTEISCISSHSRSFGEKVLQYSCQLAPPHFLQRATPSLPWHAGSEDTSTSGKRCSSLFPRLRIFHDMNFKPSWGCRCFPFFVKVEIPADFLIQALLEMGVFTKESRTLILARRGGWRHLRHMGQMQTKRMDAGSMNWPKEVTTTLCLSSDPSGKG